MHNVPQSIRAQCSWLLAVSQEHSSLIQSNPLACLSSGSVELTNQDTIIDSLLKRQL
jgi:hypothetical protein